MSHIRDVLTLYEGRPGVFYLVRRWDPLARRMREVVVPWLDVVHFTVNPLRQEQEKRKAKAVSASATAEKGQKKRGKQGGAAGQLDALES